jgi:hypothetical protein
LNKKIDAKIHSIKEETHIVLDNSQVTNQLASQISWILANFVFSGR